MSVSHLSIDYSLGLSAWIALGLIAFVGLLALRRRWRLRPIRKGIIHCGLSLWVLLAALTLVEVYFATIYDQSDSFNMTNVSKKWFQLHVKPDEKWLVLQGKQGFKFRDDREYPKSIPAGQHHICFLGDSFTFGHGVPDVRDRFSNRVRASLERSDPGKFVVTNLADAGKDLYWVELVLQQLFAHRRRVNTVVYVMCLNDIETFHPDRNKFYEELGAEGPQSFLFSETYFFNFLYYRYRQFTRPAVRNYYSFVKDYYAGEPWRLMGRKLIQVNELCRRNGARLCVVVFPFLHNLGDDYPFRGVHRQVVAFCDNAKIPVLDLDPVLTPHVGDGLTVNRFDAHPNARAHELAADAILPFLRRIVR
ncbi:MAG: SGNH/GDSL hydrolase family protein [Planctomycetaceae bacterium]